MVMGRCLFPIKMLSRQKCLTRLLGYWEMRDDILSQRNSKCKRPEEGKNLDSLRRKCRIVGTGCRALGLTVLRSLHLCLVNGDIMGKGPVGKCSGCCARADYSARQQVLRDYWLCSGESYGNWGQAVSWRRRTCSR